MTRLQKLFKSPWFLGGAIAGAGWAILILVLLWASNAYAQEVAPIGTNWWPIVSQAILPALGGGLLLLLRTYGRQLVAMIERKSGNPILAEMAHRALIVVMALYQRKVRQLKGTSSWDEAAKEETFNLAKEHLRMMFDDEALEEAAGAMGVETYLAQSVEAAVVVSKQNGRKTAVPGAQKRKKTSNPTRN